MRLEAKQNNYTAWVFAVLSFIGFLDASYLTAKFYSGTPINCSIFSGCDTVTTSVYAAILGIPISLVGAGYYLIIFLLAVKCLESGNFSFLRYDFWLVSAGFVFSLWLFYLQIFVLESLCLYCLVSAAISTTLFIVGLFMLKSNEVAEI